MFRETCTFSKNVQRKWSPDRQRKRLDVTTRNSLFGAHPPNPTFTQVDKDALAVLPCSNKLVTPIHCFSTRDVHTSLTFTLNDNEYDNLAHHTASRWRLTPSIATDESLRFHLRCIKAPLPPADNAAADPADLERTWFATPTTYPNFAALEVNGRVVILGAGGRKVDQPTDVTQHLCRGKNELSLFVLENDGPLAVPHEHYAVAVERIVFAQAAEVARVEVGTSPFRQTFPGPLVEGMCASLQSHSSTNRPSVPISLLLR